MFFCNVENATRSQGKASGKRNPKTANALQLVWIYVWMCLKEKPVLSHKAMAGACLEVMFHCSLLMFQSRFLLV